MTDIQGRCATCKHFEPMTSPRLNPNASLGHSGDYDEPEAVFLQRVKAGDIRDGDYVTLETFFDGFCLLAEMPDDEKEGAKMMASSVDGSGYRGSLLVKHDFGCVQWEAKA